MGNRSKYVAAMAAAGGAALVATRGGWLARSARRIRDAIRPSRADVPASADEAHAPGHQHLSSPRDERGPARLRSRPWTKNAHGMRHPFSGD